MVGGAVAHANADLISALYTALQRHDGEAMSACYLPTARFRDPVFSLEGPRVGHMWRMLCERGQDLRVEFKGIEADAFNGAARLDCWYTFTATGRAVHNVIQASFAFSNGRIDDHHDQFNFHRWAGQALGPGGRLLGWASPYQQAVRRRSARMLEAWIAKRGLVA